ncbi:helix-turn-helix domain-containing protein [Alicyclobacillus sp. ALC3]|uniref:helix-turn-helix domain-containing protein n=1 Tax=Alicyclobacillus sp. ALC3 TaxID=2796143 RepID=UPI002378A48B|nr:helix-turn-helix transcriptional regulator [Alicyclobacillus sp. ALC3]WDL99197.1 helix-turn-helix transcriptional regulator [Alicyclobacillus sp. ALC3]
MSELSQRLGERIRILRKQRGLSQEKLGEQAGLHTNYIGQMERGEKNLTIGTLEKVASGLGVSLEEVFRYVDPAVGEDKISEITHLLSVRPSEDHEMVLRVITAILEWEQSKKHF